MIKTVGQIIGKQMPVPAKDFDTVMLKSAQYLYLIREFKAKVAKHAWLLPIIDIQTTIGIEIEVENIKGKFPLPSSIVAKQDHSLRNGGVEYTTVPLYPEQAFECLAMLWLMFDNVNKGKRPDFSWRTSDHLHLDVTQLTEAEFQRFLLLSVVFEKLLFAMSGENREQSVYCVPLAESSTIVPLHAYIKKEISLQKMILQWPKYTAVNLMRMMDSPPSIGQSTLGIGTVEFRHQAGTKKLEHLLVWIATILRLYQFSKDVSQHEFEARLFSLNTDCTYAEFMQTVLTAPLANKFIVQSFPKLFSRQVSIAKRTLISSTLPKSSSKSTLQTFIDKDIKKKEERLQQEAQSGEKLRRKFKPPFNPHLGNMAVDMEGVQLGQNVPQVHPSWSQPVAYDDFTQGEQ